MFIINHKFRYLMTFWRRKLTKEKLWKSKLLLDNSLWVDQKSSIQTTKLRGYPVVDAWPRRKLKKLVQHLSKIIRVNKSSVGFIVRLIPGQGVVMEGSPFSDYAHFEAAFNQGWVDIESESIRVNIINKFWNICLLVFNSSINIKKFQYSIA